MSQLHTVEAYVVDAVKQQQLPGELDGCPLSAEARRLLLADCPAVFTTPETQETITDWRLSYTPPTPVDTYDTSGFTLNQPSLSHCRSFELIGDNLNKWWQDEYGNQYASLNLKGNNFSNPGVMEHPTACDGFVAWGLQESKIIERVLRASQVLRERGVGTEYIVGLAEPKSYPWPLIDNETDAHELVTLSEYKRRIIAEYWRELPEDQQSMESLADLTAKFSEMTFYVSMRAADTAYRLGDISKAAVREKVFGEVNTYFLREGEKPFDALPVDDHVRFLRDHFAPTAGRNLARIHLDLGHGFAHAYNMTAFGSFVDLDSIHGEALGMGDEPVSNQDRAEDIMRALCALSESIPIEDIVDKDRTVIGSFVAHYFQETERLFGDKTVEHLAGVITAIEDLTNTESSWLSARSDQVAPILKLIKKRFMTTYFKGFERGDGIEAVGQSIDRSLELYPMDPSLIEDTKELLLDNIDYYGRVIVDDHINELVDPAFDAVGAFFDNTPRTEVYKYMVEDVDEMIRSTIASYCTEQVTKYLPDITHKPLRRILFDALLAERDEALRAAAKPLVADALPELEDKIREACMFERPTSLVPDAYSRPNTGDNKKFWIATEDIPLVDVMTTLQDGTHQLDTTYQPDLQKGTIKFTPRLAGSRLVEIITDGLVDSVVIENNTTDISFYPEQTTSYALFIEEATDGQRQLNLYMNDGEKLSKFGKVAISTPEPSDPYQNQLF